MAASQFDVIHLYLGETGRLQYKKAHDLLGIKWIQAIGTAGYQIIELHTDCDPVVRGQVCTVFDGGPGFTGSDDLAFNQCHTGIP